MPKKQDKPDTPKNQLVGNNRQKMEYLLSFAILAPSTHNTQPWRIELGEDSCKLFADYELQLPVADITKRNMYISLGGFAYNLETTARAYDVLQSVEFTDQKSKHVATFKFKNLDNKNQIIKQSKKQLECIQARYNYRGEFLETEISKELVSINKVVTDAYSQFTSDKQIITKIGELTGKAIQDVYKKKTFRNEMANWIHWNYTKKTNGMPGRVLRMNLAQSLVLPHVIRHVDIGSKLAALNLKSFTTAPGLIVFSSKNNTKRSWLDVGIHAQQTSIMLFDKGIVTSTFSAAIEDRSSAEIIRKLTGLPTDQSPQYLFCVGRPKLSAMRTPRTPIQKKMLKN
jgi:hypothetical protein